MKKYFIFLLLFSLFIQSSFAQSIRGTVLEKNGAAAGFATVLLYSAQDTALVKGAITTESGNYEFEDIRSGTYFINASIVGLGKGFVPVFDYKGGDLKVGDMFLDPSDNELGEVTIVARKPILEVKADRMILNVEGNLNSIGQSALEVLRKAPGVMVDNNDNISLKGKNQVKFLIDGREVPMGSTEVANMLKNMRSEDIEAFEMITNPSAKFDAAGNAGIINIRTKKNRNLGTNGTIGGSFIQGETAKGGINLSLNHRNEKMNVYATYGNHFGYWHNQLFLYREQGGRIFDQESNMSNNGTNHNYKLGTDYSINSKHSVGFIFNGNYAPGSWHNDARTDISNIGSTVIDSILVALNDVPQVRNNNSINLNYRFADTSGHEFTFDIDRGFYRSSAHSYQPNRYMDPLEQRVLSENIFGNNTPTDIDIFTVKGDYEQNLLKGKFALGFKIADIKTDNLFDFFNEINGERIQNVNRSNRFIYRERTSAAYVNYAKTVKKIGIQAGLRVENTDYMGDLESFRPGAENETVENNYTKLFPSAAVTYTMNAKHQFGLTYSRRIDRPNYQDLNPFEEQLDELSYRKGNPFLRPQFTNSLELTHTFMGFLTTTTGYSRTVDMFSEIIDTAEVKRTFLTNANVAQQDNYSLSISAPLPIAKWWEGYLSVTGIYAQFDANFRPGYTYSASYKTMNLYSEQTFRLPKSWSVQLSGWYNSAAIWGAVFRARPQGAMDLAIQKKILDGQGDIRLSFGDILRTANWSSINDFTPGLYMRGKGTWESRTIRLNVSYNFGNKNVKSARRHDTGLDAESKRIKS